VPIEKEYWAREDVGHRSEKDSTDTRRATVSIMSDAQQPEEQGVAVPTRRRNRDAKPVGARNALLAVLLVMGAVGISSVVVLTMKDKAVYSKPVDALLNDKGKFLGRPVRVEGNLVHGTLVHHDKPCEYDFTIEKNGSEMPVKFKQCVVPDTFRDVPGMDVGVTVEGQLLADNSFDATTVLAKCPSKYEMKNRAAQGEQMPHGAVGAAAVPNATY